MKVEGCKEMTLRRYSRRSTRTFYAFAEALYEAARCVVPNEALVVGSAFEMPKMSVLHLIL